MRAGNTDRAVTVAEPLLNHVGRQIGERLGHVGSLDGDVIATERGFHVLDLNPRLGGGYPFSHLAGANLPRTLIAWASGDIPDPNWLKTEPGVVVSKYDDLVVMDQPELAVDPLRDNKPEARLSDAPRPKNALAHAPLPSR
jgi:carbamoyl-phosphate synthase large subunit